MAKLIVNPGTPVAWEIQLKPGINSIGRGPANDFKIADPSVSSSHCQLELRPDGALLKDLGSTNGTFLNRAPIKEALLRNGQTLHLGGVELQFVADPAAAAVPAQSAPTVGARETGPRDIGTACLTPAAAPIPAQPAPTRVAIGIPLTPTPPETSQKPAPAIGFPIPAQPLPAIGSFAIPAAAPPQQPLTAASTASIPEPVNDGNTLFIPRPPPLNPNPPAGGPDYIPAPPPPTLGSVPPRSGPVVIPASPVPRPAQPPASGVPPGSPQVRISIPKKAAAAAADPVIPITIPPRQVATEHPHPPISLAPRATQISPVPIPVAPAPASLNSLPAVPPPLVPPTIPTPSGGPGKCKFHPKTAARYFCAKCRHHFCELCVTSRTVGTVAHKYCRHCGAECVPVQVHIERPVEIGFFGRLPGAFAYPFRGGGFFVMLIGILVLCCLKWARYMILMGGLRSILAGITLEIFAGGYLFTFLQTIIHSTAAEDREMPDVPGMSNFSDDILLPFFRLLGLFLACFGIAIPLAIWAGPMPALAAGVFGGLYFPMAFLAVAILDSIGAVNPLVVIPSIFKVPIEYFVTVLLLGFVYALGPFGDFVLGAAFPRGLLSHSMGETLAYLAASAFWGFMSFYFVIVTVHILGLLYVSKKEKLAWLDR